MESVIAGKVTRVAEENGLLPDEQMGNRAHRSTELAVRLVVAQVQEAWRQKAAASLLQLDISGAFDTVNHVRLLATLGDKSGRSLGLPTVTNSFHPLHRFSLPAVKGKPSPSSHSGVRGRHQPPSFWPRARGQRSTARGGLGDMFAVGKHPRDGLRSREERANPFQQRAKTIDTAAGPFPAGEGC